MKNIYGVIFILLTIDCSAQLKQCASFDWIWLNVDTLVECREDNLCHQVFTARSFLSCLKKLEKKESVKTLVITGFKKKLKIPNELSSLINLEVLIVDGHGGNMQIEFEHDISLPSLKYFCAHSCPISQVPEFLLHSHELRFYSAYMDAFSEKDLDRLSKFDNLEVLDLIGATKEHLSFWSEEILELPSLQQLFIYDNTEISLEELKKMNFRNLIYFNVNLSKESSLFLESLGISTSCILFDQITR